MGGGLDRVASVVVQNSRRRRSRRVERDNGRQGRPSGEPLGPTLEARLARALSQPGVRWRFGRAGASATALVSLFGLLEFTGLKALGALLVGASAGLVLPPRTQSRLRAPAFSLAAVLFFMPIVYAASAGRAPRHHPACPRRNFPLPFPVRRRRPVRRPVPTAPSRMYSGLSLATTSTARHLAWEPN